MPTHDDHLQETLIELAQRAAFQVRPDEVRDLNEALDLLERVRDELFSLRMRIGVMERSRDAARDEHEVLQNALMQLDEHHPLVGEMIHTVRREEWDDMRRDGLLTPNEMADALEARGIDRDRAVFFVQWLIGDREYKEGVVNTFVRMLREMGEHE